MLYTICYKDKVLQGPMPKEEAEMKLLKLNKMFINLKLVPITENNEGPTNANLLQPDSTTADSR